MVLIDTDVLIEVLRGSRDAKAWLDSLQRGAFQIPGIVAMELVMGCRNQAELRQIRKFLDRFDVTWPDPAELASAYELLLSLHLSSGIGIPDCVLGAMAVARGARLYTFNLKHFKVIPGLDAQRPYSRN
jgi:predicted nucleic acid-binding protein